MSSEPASIDVSLTGGVDIVWRDGHASHYQIPALRDACPCAGCQDLHGDGKRPQAPKPASVLPMFKPTAARLLEVKPVGRYALHFSFSDGHSTGIYTWEYLRSLCPCPVCHPHP